MASRLRPIRDPMPGPNTGRWWDRVQKTGMPERYWRASTKAISQYDVKAFAKNAMATAKEWLGSGRGYYLHGILESGKSSVAAILLKNALRRCERCLWLPCREIPSVIFRDRDDPTEELRYKKLRRCDLLVVDDLGSESFRLTGPAGSALETAFRIIYDRRRSVIITSNLSWGEFYQIYKPQAEPLVSVIERIVTPQPIRNDQWKIGREGE